MTKELTNRILWKLDGNTQHFLSEVEKRKQEIKNDLADGVLLVHNTSDKLAIEYGFNAGVIEGLNFLQSYLEDNSND